MATPKVYESEYRFCLILWEHEPVKSTELVKLCQEQLGWKKATTYTVIKRLVERGVLKSENAVVSSLVSKSDIQASEIDDWWRKPLRETSLLLLQHLPGIGSCHRRRYRKSGV